MQEQVFILQYLTGIHHYKNSLFIFFKEQESKAALPTMCRSPYYIWAALQFKFFSVKHTVYRCSVGEPFIFSSRFMILPLKWLSESSYFHWTKPPSNSWMLLKFRECTCHLLRVLSVTLCGLHWPYVRLCMHTSGRSKMQINKKKSHKLIVNGWFELPVVNK